MNFVSEFLTLGNSVERQNYIGNSGGAPELPLELQNYIGNSGEAPELPLEIQNYIGNSGGAPELPLELQNYLYVFCYRLACRRDEKAVAKAGRHLITDDCWASSTNI